MVDTELNISANKYAVEVYMAKSSAVHDDKSMWLFPARLS